MSTPRALRGSVKRIAGSLATVVLLATPALSTAAPTATISRNALRIAMNRRAEAHGAVVRDARRLSFCRRRHAGHCRAERRAMRRARATLARDRLRVNRLRAKISVASHATQPSKSVPAASSTNFGEPFVKGVDTNMQGWGTEAIPQIASEMNSLGANWAREDLSWSDVEPHPGVFDWSTFDQTVAAAQANGITILPIVGYAPSWASPTDATDYAAFVKAAVERYGPGTQANLRWWELWNEPYFSYAWDQKTSEPGAYARDVVAASQAAKGVSSSVKVLVAADYEDAPEVGGSSPWQTAWIDDMFTAEPSLGRWIDGVSIHPYGDDPALGLAQPGGFRDSSGGWSFQRVDTARAKFLAHGVNVPFWITETGASTSEVSESAQATYYNDLIPQVASRPWIRALFPYCLREFEASGGKESQYGLLRYGSWEPKPAFYALQKGLGSLS